MISVVGDTTAALRADKDKVRGLEALDEVGEMSDRRIIAVSLFPPPYLFLEQ